MVGDFNIDFFRTKFNLFCDKKSPFKFKRKIFSILIS